MEPHPIELRTKVLEATVQALIERFGSTSGMPPLIRSYTYLGDEDPEHWSLGRGCYCTAYTGIWGASPDKTDDLKDWWENTRPARVKELCGVNVRFDPVHGNPSVINCYPGSL